MSFSKVILLDTCTYMWVPCANFCSINFRTFGFAFFVIKRSTNNDKMDLTAALSKKLPIFLAIVTKGKEKIDLCRAV